MYIVIIGLIIWDYLIYSFGYELEVLVEQFSFEGVWNVIISYRILEQDYN